MPVETKPRIYENVGVPFAAGDCTITRPSSSSTEDTPAIFIVAFCHFSKRFWQVLQKCRSVDLIHKDLANYIDQLWIHKILPKIWRDLGVPQRLRRSYDVPGPSFCDNSFTQTPSCSSPRRSTPLLVPFLRWAPVCRSWHPGLACTSTSVNAWRSTLNLDLLMNHICLCHEVPLRNQKKTWKKTLGGKRLGPRWQGSGQAINKIRSTKAPWCKRDFLSWRWSGCSKHVAKGGQMRYLSHD